MHIKLHEKHLKIRIIFFLVAQTVCMLAVPAQATVMQQICGAFVCEETQTTHTVSPSVRVQHQKQQQFYRCLTCLLAASVLFAAAFVLLHPVFRTPVQLRVRMDQ